MRTLRATSLEDEASTAILNVDAMSAHERVSSSLLLAHAGSAPRTLNVISPMLDKRRNAVA